MPPRLARKAWRFLTRDLWRIRSRRLSRGRGFLLRLLRVIILAGRGFRDDKCNLRASALTFYSLLSVIPVVAMAFGVAKGFGQQDRLEAALRKGLQQALPSSAAPAADEGRVTPPAGTEKNPLPPEGTGKKTAPPDNGTSFESIDPEEDDKAKSEPVGPLVAESAAPAPASAGPPTGAGPTGPPAANESSAASESGPPQAGPKSEIADYIVRFANNLLEQTQTGWLAGIGVLILFYTVIKVLGQIEHSFNDIWGIKKSRPLSRKLADYLVAMLVGPLLFMVASSVTFLATEEVNQAVQSSEVLSKYFGPAVQMGTKILPFAVIWLMFTFFYVFMPNTKVRFSSALIAGVVAGSVYQVVQWGYLYFQIGVSKYGGIYGSFAALPLFLIWLQTSWLVVLFGAEISFAWQNVETYEFESDCLAVSQKFKRLLSLRVAHLLVKNFQTEKKPMTAGEISHKLEIPIRLVNEILFELVDCAVAAEAREDESGEVAYQLAKPPERFTVKFVVDALEGRGTHDIPVSKGPDFNRIKESLAEFDAAAEKSKSNVALTDI